MKIESVAIHNFRSIKNINLKCNSFFVLLGPNNHGKSNILAALDYALSSGFKLNKEDFFAFREQEDNKLWVEVSFGNLSEQEKATFRRYISNNGTLTFRKTATIDHDGQIKTDYNGYIEEPEPEWLKQSNISNLLTREAISTTPLAGLVPASGRIKKQDVEDAQRRYIDENSREVRFSRILESTPLLGEKRIAGGILPEYYLIPAVKELSEETKIKSTTAFGRLLSKSIQEMAQSEGQFIEIKNSLRSLVDSFNATDETTRARPRQLIRLEELLEEELRDWQVSVSIEITPPEIERIFELGTNLHLDDGLKTLAEKKGHGLQRALILALIKAWAKYLRQSTAAQELQPRRASESVYFAIEEPELYLHPHAQRILSDSLREISRSNEHQVFICTHSTNFIELDYYKDIAIIAKNICRDGTCIRQCTVDLFEGDRPEDAKQRFHMAKWINPDRGEMFFAQKVVFVEGETEKIIIPFLAKKLGIYNPSISVIDCGSKHNLPLYIKLANAYSLKYFVVHDEDPLPDPIPSSWNPEKIASKRRTFQLNTTISQLVNPAIGITSMHSPDFEGALGVSRTQGERKGKALAALEHFEQIQSSDIPLTLVQTIRAIYS